MKFVWLFWAGVWVWISQLTSAEVTTQEIVDSWVMFATAKDRVKAVIIIIIIMIIIIIIISSTSIIIIIIITIIITISY